MEKKIKSLEEIALKSMKDSRFEQKVLKEGTSQKILKIIGGSKK